MSARSARTSTNPRSLSLESLESRPCAEKSFHLVEELDFPLSTDRFRAAFPKRRASSFILGDPDATPRASSSQLDQLGGSGRPQTPADRFVFMGAEPIATLRATRVRRDPSPSPSLSPSRALSCADVTITDVVREHRSIFENVDPFDALRSLIAQHTPPPGVLDTNLPFPLRVGLVGYIGYECGQILERLPCLPRPSIGMPDMAFGVHDWVLAGCRQTGQSWLSILGTTRKDAERIRDRIVLALNRATKDVSSGVVVPRKSHEARTISNPEAELSRDEYIERVLIAKEHITSGDAFEICLTNALRSRLTRDTNDNNKEEEGEAAWSLFQELRHSNPAPFGAILDLPEGAVVSSSPERFLSLEPKTRTVESRPIKGTRPRGVDPDDDARLARELATSEKDRAENAMIVDLVRNDLGRVCRFGTVEVPALYAVERYATVHQLVSTVRGALRDDKDGIDLIRACFPPGSMTGAPKIEAMSILEHLEPVERGVYSGALGWIDLGGAMDLSVVIRTAVVKNNVVTFSVGGAIVADSDPIAEYEETEHKARALLHALETIEARSRAERSSGGEPTRAKMRREGSKGGHRPHARSAADGQQSGNTNGNVT